MSDSTPHTCPVCNTRHDRLSEITLHLERDGIALEVNGVPAYVCPNCGEQLIPGPLAVALGDAVDAIVRAEEEARREAGRYLPMFRGLTLTDSTATPLRTEGVDATTPGIELPVSPSTG